MSEPGLAVEREEDEFSGRYVIRLGAGAEAEMTYRKTGAGGIAVDHTFTPPAHRGHNIAQQMMDRLIADARAEGTRIIPHCSYVVAQFRRHPEWADLLAR